MDNKKNDPKYFYIVVLITFGLVSIIIWQLFFSNYKPFIAHKGNIENLPAINFAFLDSYNFEGLSFFHRADDPLLDWEETNRNNPFDKPVPPEEQELKKWWGVFNIKLNLSEKEFKGSYPETIEEKSNPELVLFEGRAYNLIIENSEKLECKFQFISDEGESLYEKEINEKEDKLQFKAERDIVQYICGEIKGSIQVTKNKAMEKITFGDRFESDFTTLENNLSRLYQLLGDSDKYNKFQEEFNELRNQQADKEISSNILYSDIKTLNQEINQEIEVLNTKNKEEALDQLSKLREVIDSNEGEALTTKASETINKVFEKIDSEEDYTRITESIETIKVKYNNEEINNEDLKKEFNGLYQEVENIINDLD